MQAVPEAEEPIPGASTPENYARAGSPLVLSAVPMVSGSVLRASCVEGNR